MRLSQRKANSILRFRDADSGETLLALISDARGQVSWSYRLYDADATLVADCEEPQLLPEGVSVLTPSGELLLNVPTVADEAISYRLYNSRGFLTTASDGQKTQIFGFLRIEDK